MWALLLVFLVFPSAGHCEEIQTCSEHQRKFVDRCLVLTDLSACLEDPTCHWCGPQKASCENGTQVVVKCMPAHTVDDCNYKNFMNHSGCDVLLEKRQACPHEPQVVDKTQSALKILVILFVVGAALLWATTFGWRAWLVRNAQPKPRRKSASSMPLSNYAADDL